MPLCFIMAALRSRCGHYIFAPRFLSIFRPFFPRLISAVADWMSTILSHMVWPYAGPEMDLGWVTVTHGLGRDGLDW